MQQAIRIVLLLLIFGPFAAMIIWSAAMLSANNISVGYDPSPDVVQNNAFLRISDLHTSDLAERLEQKPGPNWLYSPLCTWQMIKPRLVANRVKLKCFSAFDGGAHPAATGRLSGRAPVKPAPCGSPGIIRNSTKA